MGQGQQVAARSHVVAAAAEGRWVLLQNTHLNIGYLEEVCMGRRGGLVFEVGLGLCMLWPWAGDPKLHQAATRNAVPPPPFP